MARELLGIKAPRVGLATDRYDVAIREYLQVRELILDKRPASEIRRVAHEEGMTFLRESAVEKVLQGVTTLREINKVTFVD